MIQIFINEEEVVCDKSITIKEEMLATSSTILNNCFPKTWDDNKDYYSNFYFPQDYSLCRILKDGNLIFAGVVKNTGNVSLKPEQPKYINLQILTFKTFLSEGETLDFVISEQTITEAIESVIDAVKDYGFIVGNINIFNGDEVIGAYSTLNKSAYDVLQYLADISGSRWFTRFVDINTIAIDFYAPSLMEAGKNLEYNTTFFEENSIQDLTFSYSTNDYRNKQVMLSDEIYASIDYTENILTDGYNTTFSTQSTIGIMQSIYLDGTEQSFTTNENKELGFTADFYYTPGGAEITSDTTLSSGSRIVVTYTPLVKGREIVYNNDEVARINSQIGRKGIVARYETRNDALSSFELTSVGQSYITYKGSPEITLTLITKDNDMYNIGQVVYFEAPITELATQYMIKTKQTEMISTGSDYVVWYTYTLTSSFNSENAINYFDNQRNKASGNISEGESIDRNIDIESTANIIWSGVIFTEVEITDGNVLNSTLNSTFNN